MRLRRRAILAAPLAAVPLSGCLSTRGPTVPEGQKAPDFVLPSHEGRDVSLESLLTRGPAVLVFYRGFW